MWTEKGNLASVSHLGISGRNAGFPGCGEAGDAGGPGALPVLELMGLSCASESRDRIWECGVLRREYGDWDSGKKGILRQLKVSGLSKTGISIWSQTFARECGLAHLCELPATGLSF